MTQAIQTQSVSSNSKNGANTPFLEQVSVVWLDINIWSGQTKLKPEDLKLGQGSELPPTQFANLGSKKLLDPKRLNCFTAIKTQAHALLAKDGIRFMNGYAIPIAKAKDLAERLDDINKSFQFEKSQFLMEFEDLIEEWCRSYPEYEKSIRSCSVNKSDLDKKINFSYQIFQIEPASVNADRLEQHSLSLYDSMIDEIIKVSNDFYYQSCHGKDWISARTRPTLVGLRDKIDGLSFLNGNFVNLVSLLNSCIYLYDKKINGKIHSPHYHQIVNSVLILSDKDKIEAYGRGDLSIDPVNDPQGSLTVSEVENAPDEDVIAGFFEPEQPRQEVPVVVKQVATEAVVHEETKVSSLDDDIANFFSNSANTAPKQDEIAENEPAQVVIVPELFNQPAAVVHRSYDDDNALF